MKKLFSIFCCILLSTSMVTQAQQVQRITQSTRLSAQSSIVSKNKQEEKIADNSIANAKSIQLLFQSDNGATTRRSVAPIHRAFPSFNYTNYPNQEDDGQAFTLAETTVEQTNDHEFHIEGTTTIQVQQSWGTDYGTAKSELYLYTDGTTDYLPSGLYNIETSHKEFTGSASTSDQSITTYGGYVYWYNSTYKYVFFLYIINGGSVYVINPDHAAKPNYIGLVGTELDGDGAQWWSDFGPEPDKRTVTFTWGNNGSEDGNDFQADIEEPILEQSGNSFKVYQTSVFTLTPQPKAGWRFVRWTGTNSSEITDNGDGTYRLSVGAKDYSIAAIFEEAPAGAITAVASPVAGGSVTVSPSGSQAAGTEVTLTPNANPGYVFTGWADGGNDNPRTVYVAGDREYTANFALLRTINVAADPVAYGSVTGGGSYADGATATLTATANSGYKFLQWSDGNSSNPRSFTVNASTAAVTYTAEFVESRADFEYHFEWTRDGANKQNGNIYASTGYSKKYQICHINLIKDYSTTNAMGYPALAYDIITTQTKGSQGGYKEYGPTGMKLHIPYPGTYSNVVTATSVGYNDRGSIIKNATSPAATYTKIYLSSTESYNITSGSFTFVDVTGQTYPFLLVEGNFSGKTAYITVGTPPTYTVNLNSKRSNTNATTAGTGAVTVTYTQSTNLTTPITVPTMTGYTFDGYWSNNGGSGTQVIDANGNFITNASGYINSYKEWIKTGGNITLYAKWTAKTYTVNLNNQEATTAGTASVTATYNAAMPSATMPTKAGYAFNGYYTSTNGGGTQYYTAAGASARNWNIDTNPSTLYAYWTQKTYTLSATTNPAGLGSVTFSKSAPYHYNDAVTLTAPAATGYTFSGWGGTNSSMMSGNVFTFSADAANNTAYAVTANYKANEYTITLNNQSATTGGTSSQTVDYRTALPDITVPTKTGNAFGGYFTETNGGGTMLIGTDGKWVKNISGYTDASGNLIHADNFELFAKWTELVTFTIASYSNGTVTVTPNDGSGAFTTGSRDLAVGIMVTLNFAAAEHYHISYVTLKGNQFTDGTAYTLKTGDGTVTLIADFLPDTYAITYNKGANGTGADIAAGEKTYNVNFTLSSSTFTRTGYTQTGWSTTEGGEKAYDLGETYTGNTALDLYPYWEINTYDITWKSEDGTSTLETDPTQAYGTATAYNGATIPTKTVTGYTYTFDGWTTEPNGAGTFYANGETPTVSGAATYYAHFTGTANTHTLTWVANGGTLTGGTAAGTTAYGTALEAPTATREGYTFNGWSPSVPATMPDDDATYTAQWNRIEYTITYGGLNGETNTNPDTYTIESEDINLVAPGTRDGYIFAGWKDESDNTITQIAKGSTGNRTLTATWNVKSSNIELCENCNDAHYNTFKTNYNNEKVNVTYKRQFTAERWSTMCLPFSLDLATMIANKMYGCVYEFKYATGNANTNSGVNLYFSNAKKIEAGTCYIVNANDALAAKTSFVFSGVTIDLTKDNGVALDSEAAYDDLPGYISQGTIELVGTLRNGTLKGSATGNRYMGLKDNKIYYPNISQGSTIWAYRGIFRSSEILDKESMQKMRIIVDGEDRGELIIDEDGDILAPSDAQSRKFIENGVLYIEREGVIYDAQGKRIK